MKSILKLFFISYVSLMIFAIFQTLTPSSVRTLDSEKVYDNKMEQIVFPVVSIQLIAQKKESLEELTIGSATGFSVFFDEKKRISYILTNNHFCEKQRELQSVKEIGDNANIIFKFNKGNELVTGVPNAHFLIEPMYMDFTKDLCVMKTKEEMPVVVFEKKKVTPLTKVTIVGAPEGIFPIVLDTYISSIGIRETYSFTEMYNNGEDYLFISNIIMPGHSGSPIFNSKGRVVGIIFAAKLTMYGALALQNQDIFNFFEENNIPYYKN